jgi:hypothetical protein
MLREERHVASSNVSLAIWVIVCQSNIAMAMTRTLRFTYSPFTYRYFFFGVAATANLMCAPIST